MMLAAKDSSDKRPFKPEIYMKVEVLTLKVRKEPIIKELSK